MSGRTGHRLSKVFEKSWSQQAQLVLELRAKDGARLNISCGGAGGKWVVVAVETSGTTLGEVMASHAHSSAGPFESLGAAMVAAEDLALAWRPGQLEECPCEEMGS